MSSTVDPTQEALAAQKKLEKQQKKEANLKIQEEIRVKKAKQKEEKRKLHLANQLVIQENRKKKAEEKEKRRIAHVARMEEQKRIKAAKAEEKAQAREQQRKLEAKESITKQTREVTVQLVTVQKIILEHFSKFGEIETSKFNPGLYQATIRYVNGSDTAKALKPKKASAIKFNYEVSASPVEAFTLSFPLPEDMAKEDQEPAIRTAVSKLGSLKCIAFRYKNALVCFNDEATRDKAVTKIAKSGLKLGAFAIDGATVKAGFPTRKRTRRQGSPDDPNKKAKKTEEKA